MNDRPNMIAQCVVVVVVSPLLSITEGLETEGGAAQIVNIKFRTISDPGVNGENGDRGDVGTQGPAGPKGPQGLSGTKGETGDIGATGTQGLAGDDGAPGNSIPGPVGPSGPQGEALQGPVGSAGVSGDPGNNGPRGAKGGKGAPGPKGATVGGFAGPLGDIGVQGPQGPQGFRGPKGDEGDIGRKGSVGPRGMAGPAGVPGPSGPENGEIWQNFGLLAQTEAQSYCATIAYKNNNPGWVFAIGRNRHDPTSKPCVSICASQYENQAGQLKCLAAIAVGGKAAEDKYRKGLTLSTFPSCEVTQVEDGPNYCCCVSRS